jgi:sorting nexin-9/18/33
MFGRRQFNRFSWFVTTGVEEFLLRGAKQAVVNSDHNDECTATDISESDKHFIQVGHYALL